MIDDERIAVALYFGVPIKSAESFNTIFENEYGFSVADNVQFSFGMDATVIFLTKQQHSSFSSHGRQFVISKREVCEKNLRTFLTIDVL